MSHHRRVFLGGALGGFFAYAMRNRCDTALAQQPQGVAKRCLVLWMNGGPSQLDTFDPKPGASTGGEFKTIQTAVADVQISETLPHIAKQMGRLSIVRNLTSPEGEHERGQYYLHTGYRFVPAFPRPAMGAVVSHNSPPTDFPSYVTIGTRGYGPAYMGPDHAPFTIEDAGAALNLLQAIGRRKRRIGLLQDLGADFDNAHPEAMLSRRRAMIGRIQSMASTRFVEALNLDREPAANRQRYGEGQFAQRCLLARRLLETGVNFVEVQHAGWDTHNDNFRRTRRLCEAIDRPWAALMEALTSAGLLDETIVLWLGEFGRTPNINAQNGRDHFPRATPVVIGGGGIHGGRVIGKTNRTGTQIASNAYSVADLFATVFQALGIDPDTEFRTSFDSPTSATDDGTPIQELIQ